MHETTPTEDLSYARGQVQDLKKHVILLTRFLCIVLSTFEASSWNAFNTMLGQHTDLSNWWKMHKEDNIRRHKEAKDSLPQALKILADLSPEDLETARAQIAKIKS